VDSSFKVKISVVRFPVAIPGRSIMMRMHGDTFSLSMAPCIYWKVEG